MDGFPKVAGDLFLGAMLTKMDAARFKSVVETTTRLTHPDRLAIYRMMGDSLLAVWKSSDPPRKRPCADSAEDPYAHALRLIQGTGFNEDSATDQRLRGGILHILTRADASDSAKRFCTEEICLTMKPQFDQLSGPRDKQPL